MVIHFDFASGFANILGQASVDLQLTADEVRLGDALASLLAQYPHWRVLLEKNHYCEDGKLKAMYVCEQNIVNNDTVISDGSRIRILMPICGG